jgi:hypothetical protein
MEDPVMVSPLDPQETEIAVRQVPPLLGPVHRLPNESNPIVSLAQRAAQEVRVIHTESLTIAFLVVLERLSPLERAAILLHDVFDSLSTVGTGCLSGLDTQYERHNTIVCALASPEPG